MANTMIEINRRLFSRLESLLPKEHSDYGNIVIGESSI